MNILNRSEQMTPTRRAMTVAGVATVALSLVMSIAPVFAANVGTLKVFDAGTDTEVGNNSHVCSFYGLFDSSTLTTAHWELVNMADDAVTAEGDYPGSGPAVTADLSPAPGHYRLDWTPTGTNGKSKVLWVDAECASPSEETAPTDAATPTPTPSEETAPTDAATPTPTPSEETAPTDAATPTPTPSEEQAVEAGQSTPSASPEQDVAAGNSGTTATLPDTAVPVGESGVLATIGLLLIIAAHAGTRRERQLPVA